MRNRKRVVLVVVISLAALSYLLVPFQLHLGADFRIHSNTSIGWPDQMRGDIFRTASRIAIVPEPAGWYAGMVEHRIANDLKDKLSSKVFTAYVFSADISLNKASEIRICRDLAAARAFKPDAILFVKVTKWMCCPIPLIRPWQTDVSVKAGPPGPCISRSTSDIGHEGLKYACNVEEHASGVSVGIFDGACPAHVVADRIVDEIEGYSSQKTESASKKHDQP